MKCIRAKAFDQRAVKLSSEEGFVLSRVAGTTSLGELVDLSGLAEERVVEIVRRLVEQGTLEVEPPLTPPPSGVSTVSGGAALEELEELEELDRRT